MGKINITVDDIKEAVYRCVSAINESAKKPITVLWLDDVREPYRYVNNYLDGSRLPKKPNGTLQNNIAFYNGFKQKYKPTFVWVKNFEEFVNYIETNGVPEFVSFDHDLGYGLKKGAVCAQWLKDYCQENNLPLPKFYAHSANRHGRKKINTILGGDEDLLKEDIDEWGKRPVYSYDDKLEFVHDDNIKNGGNFGIKRNGREYWVSRSNCISLYVYCKNSEGEWCILASKRGPKMRNPNKWNVVCGFLDYGYSLESTAVKECWEETGVKISKQMLRNNGTNSSRTNGPVVTRFSCVLNGTTDKYKTSIKNCEPGEVTEAMWIPLSKVNMFDWVDNQGQKAAEAANNIVSNGTPETDENFYTIVNNLQQMLNKGLIDQEKYNGIVNMLKR